ncbi:MAG: hypothetical protein ACK4VW_08700 [Anaerolineales bacterium]
MPHQDWQLLTEIGGRLNAEETKSYLEANGIPVILFQEGAGIDLFPVAIGNTLARVQVFVPAEYLAQARELLEAEDDSGEPV